jgi:hypothetical protein
MTKLNMFGFATALLAANIVVAMPSVGDSVTYKMTQVQGTETQVATLEASLTAYDSATQTYTIHRSVKQGDQVLAASDKQEEGAKLITTDQLTKILSDCATEGGQAGTFTVAGQAMPSCTVESTSVGLVPFGLFKSVSTDTDETGVATTTTIELMNFTMGK